ncbi:MAG: hypothetical protein JXA30_22450 [Deltaproteobacteria bacterium]|nr:hypothetical protein [Deltaproteobacteria bacterium]
MLKKANAHWSAIALYSTSFAVVLVLACGGESVPSTEGISESDSESSPSDGKSEDKTTKSGDKTANEETPNTATFGTEAAAGGAAESVDGNDTITTVGAGEECSPAFEVMGMMTLFTATGICQDAAEPCVGGTPDMFDLGNLLTQVPEEYVNLLPPPVDAAANCESGLVCCINQDQCQSVNDQILGNEMVADVLNADIACVSEGTCTGDNPLELALGCPSGQRCCINISFSSPTTDGGASEPTDAGL